MNWQDPWALQPFCTFAGPCTAFHLSWDPSFKQMSINEVGKKYGLPDLCTALVDFIHCYLPSTWLAVNTAAQQPVLILGLWKCKSGPVYVYNRNHNMDEVIPPKLINACPHPKIGHWDSDSVIINTNRSKTWPWSGLAGEWNFADFDRQCIA